MMQVQKEKIYIMRSSISILIRHGQYNLKGETDAEQILTDIGRKQAKHTGQRLAELKIPIDNFVISTMARAQETGKIILDQLPHKEIIPVKNDSMIEEGAPIEPGMCSVRTSTFAFKNF
jgi:phosphohistidine phosphatase SixA